MLELISLFYVYSKKVICMFYLYYVVLSPKIPCPNCQEDEWLENNELSYLPQVIKLEDGKYVADAGNGIHVRLWRCNNCMYVMQFWEPD